MLRYFLIIFIFLSLLFASDSCHAIIFEGQGPAKTEIFECNGGTVNFTTIHYGDSVFIATLRNMYITHEEFPDSLYSFLSNNTGNCSDSITDTPPRGLYRVSVATEGDWQINVTGDAFIPTQNLCEATDEDGGCFINSLWP